MTARPPLPDRESERLARLNELMVLDSEPEPALDAIARLASETCGTPIALITLIDGRRQWFKSSVGVPGIHETPREVAFCAHTILDDALLEVPDATQDPRFCAFPSVTGPHAVRFYAGAPLVLQGGERVGALCVLDTRARQLDSRQAAMLQSLASIVTQTLTMRRDLIRKALSARSGYERALAETADELADLYDNAPCGYHSLDAVGRFVRINKTALNWLGRTEAEVVGVAGISDFLTPQGKELFRQNFPRLMGDGRVDGLEFDVVSRSGATRRVVANATTIKDADGAFLMTRTVMFDISELQRARDALRKLAADQQAILDTDLIGILKLKDRRIVWANRGAERIFGYGPKELLDQPTRVLYPDAASHDNAGDTGYQRMRAGSVFRMQVESPRKNGERIWVDVTGRMPDDSSGEVLCMVTDLSALKHAENVKARAAALEAENRHLAETGRVKGVFLSNMSHELRTPLNAVIGYAHLLQAGSVRPDSPKFAHFLRQIGESGKQLLGMIDTVLEFARSESGRLTLIPGPASVKRMLRNTVDLFRDDARRNEVAIAVEVDDGLGEVMVDEFRVSQIVAHFVSNAIKFSPKGGYIMVRAWSQGASEFRIEVEDTGIGIAEADMPRLFGAFQQLSEGNSKVYAGAGLGLALSRRIAQAHGGTVGASSRTGIGSVFWVVMPIGHASQLASI